MPRNDPRFRTVVLTDLTPRQREVLGLVAQGLTNFDIAQRLGISLEGVKYHVSEILVRLGVDSRDEAVEVWRSTRSVRARLTRFNRVLLPASLGIAGVAGVALVVALVFISRESTADLPATPAATSVPIASATAAASIPVVLPAIRDAMVAGDVVALEQLLHGRPVPCSDPGDTGLGGGGPLCPDGVAEGTPIGSYVMLGVCHGTYLPPDEDFARRLADKAIPSDGLLGVVLARQDVAEPAPFYSLVFKTIEGEARIVTATDEGIIALLMGCHGSPEEALAWVEQTDGAVRITVPD